MLKKVFEIGQPFIRIKIYIRISIQYKILPSKFKTSKIKKESLQHRGFPGGHPPKHYPFPTLLNFSDQMSTGAFSVV